MLDFLSPRARDTHWLLTTSILFKKLKSQRWIGNNFLVWDKFWRMAFGRLEKQSSNHHFSGAMLNSGGGNSLVQPSLRHPEQHHRFRPTCPSPLTWHQHLLVPGGCMDGWRDGFQRGKRNLGKKHVVIFQNNMLISEQWARNFSKKNIKSFAWNAPFKGIYTYTYSKLKKTDISCREATENCDKVPPVASFGRFFFGGVGLGT